MYSTNTTILAHAMHIIEFQRNKKALDSSLNNSLLLANMLYANGITDVDVKVGSVVGYFRDNGLVFPIIIACAWCEYRGKIIECTRNLLDIENAFYSSEFATAAQQFDRILTKFVDRDRMRQTKVDHLNHLFQLQKTYKNNGYMLDEKDEYVKSYMKYCEEDTRLKIIM